MTQNRRPTLPGFDTALADHARQLRELSRGPGAWIYVGTFPGDPLTTQESPPFENGWGNSGGIYPHVSFYIDKWQRVHIRGGATGGVVGTVIFTLPREYRPAKTEPFVCATATGGVSVIEVSSSGAVTQIS